MEYGKLSEGNIFEKSIDRYYYYDHLLKKKSFSNDTIPKSFLISAISEKNILLIFFITILCTIYGSAQPIARQIILKNDLISRTFDTADQCIQTTGYVYLPTGYDFSRQGSNEFCFKLNGEEIRGFSPYFGKVDYALESENGYQQLSVYLTGKENSPVEKINLSLFYRLHENSNAVVKWMSISNNRKTQIIINDLFWEDLMMDPQGGTGSDIYADYGRVWKKPPYTGGKDDPAIQVSGTAGSIILGNESPGMMKQTRIFHELNRISIGLTDPNDKYAFQRVIHPDETFETPESFIILCEKKHPEKAFEYDLGEYIRNYMGVKLFQRQTPPLFLYNTWNPFRININEDMINEIADALEGTGVEYLIIDDGWQDYNGDWNVNKEKFPHGLKPVSDYIASKGMKPGAWISLTVAQKESESFREMREYAVKDIQGNPANLHGWSNNFTILTMNLVSPWYDVIKEKVFSLVGENNLKYLKIDLAMVKSAYILEKERSGTHDTTRLYTGREDFLLKSFEHASKLFDEMNEEFPELIIDCTFELWGDWHIIDYPLIKHADVEWIANFEAPPPEGPMTIRTLAWNRGLVIPTQPMVIGNQKLEVENHQLAFLSNFASTPIMLGDPRKLSADEKSWYKAFHDWFRNMNDSYQITQYYQTHNFSDKPARHNWDGFGRFNYGKQGGIFCVFRNDSPDKERNFNIPWVKETGIYHIIEAPDEKTIGKFDGKTLISEGVKIIIDERNSGKAFEIRPVD